MVVLNKIPDTFKPRPGGIRLVMICGNEEAVIERCLRSALPLISSYAISCNGTDRTAEIIQEVLKGIPGKVFQCPWVSFGHNRTESIQLARTLGKCDFFLMIDADEEFVGDLSAIKNLMPFTNAFACDMFPKGEPREKRPILLGWDVDWKYSLRVHEYLEPAKEIQGCVFIPTIKIVSHNDGGRHNVPGWVEGDIAMALEDYRETLDPHVGFTLARMYENNKRLDEAEKWYQLRADNQRGWDEERWYSLWRLAEIHRAKTPEFSKDVIKDYWTAINHRPTRSEPAYRLASYLMEHGYKQVADEIIAKAKAIKTTYDCLCVDTTCYEALNV